MPPVSWPQVPITNLVPTPDEHIVASAGITGKLYTKRIAPGGRWEIEVTFVPFWQDQESKVRRTRIQRFVSRMSHLIDGDDPPWTRIPLANFSEYIPQADFGTGPNPTISAKNPDGSYTLSSNYGNWEDGEHVSIALSPTTRLLQIDEVIAANMFKFIPDFDFAVGTIIQPAEFIEVRRKSYQITRQEAIDNSQQRPTVVSVKLVERHVETTS